MAKRIESSGVSFLPLFFCCQLATLGLLRQTPAYSLWEAHIAAYPTFSLWLARVLSVLVLALAVIAVQRGASPLAHRRLLFANGVLLLAGASVTLYAASNLPLYLIGQALIGVSHAWVLVCWAERLSRLGTRERNRCIAVSALIAVALFALVGLAPWVAKGPLFLLVTLGSFVPLLVPQSLDANGEFGVEDRRQAAGGQGAPTLQQTLAQLPAALFVLMASYAMLFRMLVFFDFPVNDETLYFLCASAIRIGGMALLLAYLAKKRFQPSIRQMILPLLFLTAVGVALLPATGGFMSSLSVAIVESSWTFFYTIIWLVLFELGRGRGRRSVLLVFLSGWTVMNALLLVAAPLASLFKSQVSEGTLSLTALALVIIYMLSVAMLLLRKKPAAARTGEDAPATPAVSTASWKEEQEAFHRALAESRSLTKRETEVFELLAQGYSLPSIEEQFVLSHSTVKGHARNIYRKFDVGGKQELIELVDRLRKQTGN